MGPCPPSCVSPWAAEAVVQWAKACMTGTLCSVEAVHLGVGAYARHGWTLSFLFFAHSTRDTQLMSLKT